MEKKILILGNGFDLDIGMNTRYRDFMNSRIWREAKEKEDALLYSIVNYLEERNSIETWFDAEAELLNYALEVSEGTYLSSQNMDRVGFELYKRKLKEYLQKEQTSFKEKVGPVALTVMTNILANGYFTDIYTFNYTDVKKYMAKYHVPIDIPITYMHGSLGKNDNIVLGIETDKKVNLDYNFLFKTNNRFYSYNNLIDRMDEANEIVFFGHSINGMDFPYFKDFFVKQSQPSKEFVRKKVTIFTYDEYSEERIRCNIREEGINLRDLMSRNNIVFIETKLIEEGDEHEEEKFDLFLSNLSENSKDNEKEMIRRLEQNLL